MKNRPLPNIPQGINTDAFNWPRKGLLYILGALAALPVPGTLKHIGCRFCRLGLLTGFGSSSGSRGFLTTDNSTNWQSMPFERRKNAGVFSPGCHSLAAIGGEGRLIQAQSSRGGLQTIGGPVGIGGRRQAFFKVILATIGGMASHIQQLLSRLGMLSARTIPHTAKGAVYPFHIQGDVNA